MEPKKNYLIGLTPDSIIGVVNKLQAQSFPEPIPPLTECDYTKLSSALKTPFQRPIQSTFENDFCEKSALMFCLLIENHAFSNGNKRIAVACLHTLADINDLRIDISNIKLYALAMSVTLLAKYHLFTEAVFEIKTAIKDALRKKPGPSINKREMQLLKDEFLQFLKQKNAT